MQMIWALVVKNGDIVYHQNSRGFFTMIVSSIDGNQTGDWNGTTIVVEDDGIDFFVLHGWLMWGSWGVLGLF